MAGYPPMKRPYPGDSYPGDWEGGPRGPKEPRPPPPHSDYSNHGGWTNTPYPNYDYYRGGAQGWGEYNQGGGYPPPPPQIASNPAQIQQQSDNSNANMDFTDDYAIFYGKSDQPQGRGGNQNRGGFRGRGQNQNNRGRGGNNFSGGQFRGGQGRGAQNRGAGNANANQTVAQGGAGAGTGQQRGGRGRWNQNRGRGRGSQRGMPPNQFGAARGRGKGANKSGTVVPPVHSLAKVKPAYLDLQNMSPAEKIHRFCLFLRSDDVSKVNSIQTIMNAMTSSKLGLKAVYESEELTRVVRKTMYTGVLKIDDVFLARAIQPNKKQLKLEVFQKSLDIMLTKTVAEIYNLVDPGAEAIREELESQVKAEEATTAPSVIATGDSSHVNIVGVDCATSIEHLISAVRNMKKTPDHPICTLEQASTQTHTLTRYEYVMDTQKIISGRQYCKGHLAYGGVILGWGVGLTKKSCKFDTYNNALERLKNKPLEELIVSVPDPGEPQEDKMLPEIARWGVKFLTVEQRFDNLIRGLCGQVFKEGNINLIDMTTMKNGLVPMLIFKSGTPETDLGTALVCELYIENMLIATSEGTRKRECQNKVYNSAFDILTTTSAEQILEQHKKITEEEIKNPNFVDVIIKGSAKSVESNIQGLKKFNHKLDEVIKNSTEGMVIMEHNEWSKDRVRSSFCILQFSATQNALLLQWECDQVKNKFRCVMMLQKKPIGESYGSTKNHARNLAATDALFKLYETQEVIKIIPRLDDRDKWTPYSEIEAEADKLRSEDIGEEPIIKTDAIGNPLPDVFIVKVLKAKIDAMVKAGEMMSELVWGPRIGLLETREIRAYCRQFSIRVDIRQSSGEPYLLVYWKLEWPKLVAVLKERGSYGKFKLVDRADVPNHASILDNIITDVDAIIPPYKSPYAKKQAPAESSMEGVEATKSETAGGEDGGKVVVDVKIVQEEK